jgi:hypothetical protein
MRFKGTFFLLIAVIALGSYVYFYEIKGKEARDKAKAAEKQFWKVESKDIQHIELTSSGQKIAAARKNQTEWTLTAPRQLDADSDEITRLADTATKLEQESVVEENAANLEKFGLRPAQSSLRIKTRDGKEYAMNFGIKNPTGNAAYASMPNQNRVFLIPAHFVSSFDKKVDDLRNHTVLSFEQPEAQSLTIRSPKGDIDLFKDSTDRWWFKGMANRAADSPQVRGVLNALSMGKIKEFFNESPEDYSNIKMDKPVIDATVTYGKNKAIKRLIIIADKSKLEKKGEKDKGQQSASDGTYLAKDASRPDLFFVEKELVDKLLIPPDAIRDKSLVPMQRWDIDSIILKNTRGSFVFAKSAGEWFVGQKKKAKWDAVNGILDAMEKPVKGWVDVPSSPSVYGLAKPGIHIVLKQGSNVVADCSFGKSAQNGVYAQVKGDPTIKIADPDGLSQLDRSEVDFLEAPAAGPASKK